MMILTNPSLEKIFPIILNISAFTGTLGCVFFLKWFGRRGSLLIGSLLISIFSLMLAYDFQNFNLTNVEENSPLSRGIIPIILLLIRITFSLTLGPVVWVYITEIVQPNITPLATTLNWLSLAINNTLFPIFL